MSIHIRLTCPYTSQQNGRAERILRTLNDGLRTLLFQASAPLMFWPDALAASTYLLNRRPCRPRAHATPYELLFGAPPEYAHLRIFGCLCYPNTAATVPHKLTPRSARCIFLGYPLDQRGYKCYNPMTKRVIISRHVYFDETCFPFCAGCHTIDDGSSPMPAMHRRRDPDPHRNANVATSCASASTWRISG